MPRKRVQYGWGNRSPPTGLRRIQQNSRVLTKRLIDTSGRSLSRSTGGLTCFVTFLLKSSIGYVWSTPPGKSENRRKIFKESETMNETDIREKVRDHYADIAEGK